MERERLCHGYTTVYGGSGSGSDGLLGVGDIVMIKTVIYKDCYCFYSTVLTIMK